MESFIADLRRKLSEASIILTRNDKGFEAALERWSGIDRKTPVVIVQPGNELDLTLSVKEAHAAHVPIVAACGGHSTWSTVENGMVIDLSLYKEIIVDVDRHAIVVRGGVLMKELQLALAENYQFTTVANGNTVGVIPYAIGGGISSYTPLIGYACENILSARIVVATGDIVITSETENEDLLWAIRGAGQFFGIVTELVLRTYNLLLIGPIGIRQIGTIFYSPDKAFEIGQMLKQIVEAYESPSPNHAGHLMAMKDPSKGRILMAAPQYFGTGSQFQATFKPMTDMDHFSHNHMSSTFDKHSDHLSWMCLKGEFKRFSQTGLASMNPRNFARLVDLHRELVETLPGAERSVFSIEWHTPTKSGTKARETKTSFGLKDIEIWL